jgi:uncharacterized protein (TIGR02757 family)
MKILTAKRLNTLYETLTRRQYVHPDPLEFLYDYEALRDREIVGLTASSLAYGRVAQILKSVRTVLDVMGSEPGAFLEETSFKSLKIHFKGFKHRFADGDHVAAMLAGARAVIQEYGSLHECFVSGMKKQDPNLLPALAHFCGHLAQTGTPGHLIPLPNRGSACKRMNLYLRWMVRKDAVDPGGWEGISPARLIIPLDVHIHRLSTQLGLTQRKPADIRTALEITSGFARFNPDDPVRCDFALSRIGIRKDIALADFFPEDENCCDPEPSMPCRTDIPVYPAI